MAFLKMSSFSCVHAAHHIQLSRSFCLQVLKSGLVRFLKCRRFQAHMPRIIFRFPLFQVLKRVLREQFSLAAAGLLDNRSGEGAGNGDAAEAAAHQVGHALRAQLLVREHAQPVLQREQLAQALPDGKGHIGRGNGVGEHLKGKINNKLQ